jgi:6-phosphogluconolactonase (cycloisomerase 2 family)
MQPDKWEQTKGHVLDSFSNVDVSEIELQEPEVGKKEVILFDGPLGRMKLEYYTKPVVLNRHTHGSRRIGSHTEVEYIYSKDEFSHQLKAYKLDEDENEWVEMEMERGSFNL